ncbi:uncharacterized protein [Haliotis asinina]|uniref:uncharacterized protein n=1 Tax=Haliotis asinina TaxID=109174 RepID=UPI0035319322
MYRNTLVIPSLEEVTEEKQVKTDGKLDIRFISYQSDGKESNGDCCDSNLRWGCLDQCDPKFYLCIADPDRKQPCSIYKRTTNYIDNHNTVHFGGRIQGTPNPFIIPVDNALPSSIEITVHVYDHDDACSDDHMDTLYQLINIQAAATEQTAVYTPCTLGGKDESDLFSRLKIAVRAYCDRDWYGSACERHCKATPDHSHYTCDLHTGAKMCFEGWKGDNCNQDIDECTEDDHICQHGGTCINTQGSYECTCVAGMKGKLCENITNQCALGPCLNGGTCDRNESDFKCACPAEWTGETCADKVNFCDSSPCNMGQCTPDLLTAARFKCDCDFAWVGDRCSQSVDVVNITLLGEIDDTNRGGLADGLNRLITELGKIPGRVDVKLTTNIQGESNYTTTFVKLYTATENGSFLENSSLARIFESNPDEIINEYLPLPLYPPRKEEELKVKSTHDRWDTNQYVSVILPAAGLVLMSVLLLVAFCVRRRRSGTRESRLRTVVTAVSCKKNPNRPLTNTGNLHHASVSADSSTCLPIHDVEEGSVDSNSDQTSHIQVDTGVVVVQQVRRHGDEAPPDTRCDDVSHVHVGTGTMTHQPARRQGGTVSQDDSARHGDESPSKTHYGDTLGINESSGDVTLDSGRLQGANKALDDSARQWDFEARRNVTSHTDTPLDLLPRVSVYALTQTSNYEQFDRCEEENTEGTVADDNNVEEIAEEKPYVHLVVVNKTQRRAQRILGWVAVFDSFTPESF